MFLEHLSFKSLTILSIIMYSSLVYFYIYANLIRYKSKGGYPNLFTNFVDISTLVCIVVFGIIITFFRDSLSLDNLSLSYLGSIFMFTFHLYMWKKYANIEAYRKSELNDKRKLNGNFFENLFYGLKVFIFESKCKFSITFAFLVTIITIILIPYYRIGNNILMIIVDTLLVYSIVKYTFYLKNKVYTNKIVYDDKVFL